MTRTPADIREAQKAATLAPGEASYRAYREAQAREFANEPADLPGTLRMLDEWAPDALPANELGQVPFARALMDAAADTIRKHLAGQSPKAQGEMERLTRERDAAREELAMMAGRHKAERVACTQLNIQFEKRAETAKTALAEMRERLEKMEAALCWYEEHARIGGDSARFAIFRDDHGAKARAALRGANQERGQ